MFSKNSLQKIEKIIGIIAIIMTVCAIFIAYLNPTTIYELSIYESTPSNVWALLIVSTFLAISLSFFPAFLPNYQSRSWIVGVLIIILNRISIQWMPFIRGYYTLSGDHMSNIGCVIDLLDTGHIGQDNFYPITHINIVNLHLISDLPAILICNYGTAIMSLLSILFIYLISKLLFDDKKVTIVTIIAATAVLFNRYDLYLMPNGWSLFFIPLVFFIFLKLKEHKNIYWAIIMIVGLFALNFFHPLSSLMFILILFLAGIADFILVVINDKKISIQKFRESVPFNLILIISVFFTIWILSFSLFDANVRGLFYALTSGSGTAFINEIGGIFSKLNMSPSQYYYFIIKSMGHNIIFMAVLIASFIYFIVKKYYKCGYINKILIIFFITGFIGILYMGYIFNFVPGMDTIGGERILSYTMIFIPVVIGWLFINNKNKNKKIIAGSLMILICASSVLGVYSIHPSPNTMVPGAQISECDTATFSWIFKLKNDSIGISSILSPVSRYSDLIYGSSLRVEMVTNRLSIPDHFGYTNNPSLSTSINESRYILLNPIDRLAYTSVWAPVGRFYYEDFLKLYADSTVNQIYSNGGGGLWLSQ